MNTKWNWKPLSEVCKTGAGGTPLKSRREFYEGGTIPWLLSGEIAQGNIYEAQNFITKEGLENSSAKLFPEDTVLVAMYGATAGQVGLLRFQAATNQAVCGILPNDQIVPRFLYYVMLALKDKLISQAIGNAQPNISQKKIKDLNIPVPPLPEQRRIVALLDEAFAAIDQAIANTKKNIENAKELFDSYLNEVFTKKGEGWKESSLGNFCSKIGSGATPRGGQKSYKPEGVPLIRSMNVHDAEFVHEGLAYLDKVQAEKLSSVTVINGDVLLNITGASVCRCCLVPDDITPARVNQHVSIIRPRSNIVLPEFLQYSLIAPMNKSRLLHLANSTGSTRQALTKQELEQFSVEYPADHSVQAMIADRVLAVERTTTNFVEMCLIRINSMTELRSSILDAALQGKL